MIIPASQLSATVVETASLPAGTAPPPAPAAPANPSASPAPATTASVTPPPPPPAAPAAETTPSSDPYLRIRNAKNTLGDRIELPLPGRFAELAVGGGGRFLFCLLKEAQKLVVVDLEKSQIVRELSLPSADALVAAGREKFVVVLPSQKLLQRWNLATFEREKTVPIPTDDVPTSIVLGSDSKGPILFWRSGDSPVGQPVLLWDLEQLRPLPVVGNVMKSSPRFKQNFTCSADGSTFVGWTAEISGQAYSAMRVTGTAAVSFRGHDQHSIHGHWCVPGPTGEQFFSGENKVYGYNLKPLSVGWMKSGPQEYFPFPCDDPRYFVAIRRRQAADSTNPQQRRDPALYNLFHYDAVLCSAADRMPLCGFESLEEVKEEGHIGRFDVGHFHFLSRVRYLPAAQKLIVIPTTNDRIVTYRFDLQEQLAASGRSFLYAVSKPPAVIDKGTKLTYQMDALTSGPSLTYKLENGPPGTTVSSTGLLEWIADAMPDGGVAQFVVSIAGGDGTETFHSFDVAVRDPAVVLASAGKPSSPAIAAVPTPAKTPRLSNAKQLAPNRIELPEGLLKYAPGHANGSVLLLCGQDLNVLARDGITLEQTIRLPKKYLTLIERSEYYVAVSADPDKVVDVVDKKTLKVLRSYNLPFLRFTDLVPHPRLPLCYLAFEYTTSVPSSKFLVFDELTARAYGEAEYIATWIAVDPSGRYLFAGFRDVFQDGNELLFNPGRIHIVPTFGSVDWLLSYRLGPDGKPRYENVRNNIGANGRGLRLSPDGTRLTYLSFTGSPHSRGNLVGFFPRDLDENPITYRVKDKGTCEELAFHPSLPLAASPGKDKVVFFDLHSGSELRDYLEADAVPAGAKIQRLWFSPDGKNAIFAVSLHQIDYLVSAPLKLSADELRRASTAPAVPVVRAPTPEAPVTIAAKDLEALQPADRKPLVAKEIGRGFMGSVVVIQTDESSGTGFIVGSSGYVLTCAHVVGDAMTVDVITPGIDGEKERKRTGRVLRKNVERDLAVVKVTVAEPWNTVRFNTTAKVEPGEHVTVIGNPSAGPAILTHTMTEGIISSLNRSIAGQQLIQTSAAVNPGTSGAPMFDSCGEVIGLVVLKANIEGAGFAVPVADLIAFLTGSPAPPLPPAAEVPNSGKPVAEAGKPVAEAGKPVAAPAVRTWTDSTGQFKIDAKFVSISNGSVNLLKADGSIIAVPLDKLSDADRQYLETLPK